MDEQEVQRTIDRSGSGSCDGARSKVVAKKAALRGYVQESSRRLKSKFAFKAFARRNGEAERPRAAASARG